MGTLGEGDMDRNVSAGGGHVAGAVAARGQEDDIFGGRHTHKGFVGRKGRESGNGNVGAI